jgi:hypothetical protein
MTSLAMNGGKLGNFCRVRHQLPGFRAGRHAKSPYFTGVLSLAQRLLALKADNQVSRFRAAFVWSLPC